MAHDTGFGGEISSTRVQRRKRILCAVLLAVGISLALAVPMVTGWIMLEYRFGGDELCFYEGTSAPGIWIEDRHESKIKCKLLFHRVLIFWGLAAAYFLPLGGIVAIARYFMRRNADRDGPSSELYKRVKVVWRVGGGLLIAYVAGMTLYNLFA